MRAVVQRVKECTVRVDERLCASINQGLLVYLGVGEKDSDKDLHYIADKVVHLRIFPDPERLGKMNLSAKDIHAEILVVSQFTLFGDARNGRRPSYSAASDPEKAQQFYNGLIELIRQHGLKVETGEFAAIMDITYTNTGPVTILLDSEKRF